LGQGIRRRSRWRGLVETAMSDELNDPLFERLGPIVLRLLALISVALIAVPLGLVAVLPFFN
jgi:hypothetical protein